MDKIEILKKRDVRKISEVIRQQWGAEIDDSLVYLRSTKGKIFVVNRDIEWADFERLNINSVGLYIAEVCHDGIRLSIEGSQLVGPTASKNVIDADDEEARKWLSGQELDREASGYVIIRHGSDYLGCGKGAVKRIMNFVPKIRRLP
ncbi:MAG: hypothetical protein ABH879_01540 [archaeon]